MCAPPTHTHTAVGPAEHWPLPSTSCCPCLGPAGHLTWPFVNSAVCSRCARRVLCAPPGSSGCAALELGLVKLKLVSRPVVCACRPSRQEEEEEEMPRARPGQSPSESHSKSLALLGPVQGGRATACDLLASGTALGPLGVASDPRAHPSAPTPGCRQSQAPGHPWRAALRATVTYSCLLERSEPGHPRKLLSSEPWNPCPPAELPGVGCSVLSSPGSWLSRECCRGRQEVAGRDLALGPSEHSADQY